MAETVYPGPVSDLSAVREATCIHTKKIFDSCQSKDCIEDLRLYPTQSSQPIIDQALSVKAGRARLLHGKYSLSDGNILFREGGVPAALAVGKRDGKTHGADPAKVHTGGQQQLARRAGLSRNTPGQANGPQRTCRLRHFRSGSAGSAGRYAPRSVPRRQERWSALLLR